jgi:hypothetical protein
MNISADLVLGGGSLLRFEPKLRLFFSALTFRS